MTQLIAKLVKASQLVGGKLKADKFNQEQRYGYISADKILAECGQALADSGVMVIPELADTYVDATPYTSARGNATTRYDARVNFIMHICDDETSIKFMWVGLGSDFTAQDKAVYKAITSGHRYFLAKLLTVGEGNEDGEHEGDATTGTEATGATKATGQADHKSAALSANTIPTCPLCTGPMWDNSAKVAQALADGKNPGPLYACKKGKYNPTTKKTDGCNGKIWQSDQPTPAPEPPPAADDDTAGWDALEGDLQRRAAAIRARILEHAADEEEQLNEAPADLVKRVNSGFGIAFPQQAERRAIRLELLQRDVADTGYTVGEANCLLPWFAIAKQGNDWLPSAQCVEDGKVILAALAAFTTTPDATN